MESQTRFESLPRLRTILEIRTKGKKASMPQLTLTCANAGGEDATSPQRKDIVTPSPTPLNTRSFTPINNHDDYVQPPYIKPRVPIMRSKELQIDSLSHTPNGKIPRVYDNVPLWERILLKQEQSQSNFDDEDIAEDTSESDDEHGSKHGSKRPRTQNWRE